MDELETVLEDLPETFFETGTFFLDLIAFVDLDFFFTGITKPLWIRKKK